MLFDSIAGGLSMEKIVIKIGGGLITDKSTFKSPRLDIIQSVAKVIAELSADGHKFIVIHGAGSYGHLESKKWGLATGAEPERIDAQRKAVTSVRNDMLELNKLLVDAFTNYDIQTMTFPPSDWVEGIGSNFKGDLSKFNRKDNVIPISFGDVVNRKDTLEFGILSGDDLMVRISKEIPGVSHCIFLLGDTPGLMTKPPNEPESELIKCWSSSENVVGTHSSAQDVTGGIFLKTASAGEICQKIPVVWMLDGRKPERITELISTGQTIGTKIIP